MYVEKCYKGVENCQISMLQGAHKCLFKVLDKHTNKVLINLLWRSDLGAQVITLALKCQGPPYRNSDRICVD